MLTLDYVMRVAGLLEDPKKAEPLRAKIDEAMHEHVARLRLEYMEDKESGDVRIVNTADRPNEAE